MPTGVHAFLPARDWMKPLCSQSGCGTARSTKDGFVSLGDMGWVDEQGYLFLADRRVDLIITGGENIYPAEVEAALSEHPEISDVVVIGVPDEDWGKRVHAVVQPADVHHPPSVRDLDRHVRERLASHKVPKSYEFAETVSRQASGKVRRTRMVEERAASWTEAMIPAPKSRHRSTPTS